MHTPLRFDLSDIINKARRASKKIRQLLRRLTEPLPRLWYWIDYMNRARRVSKKTHHLLRRPTELLRRFWYWFDLPWIVAFAVLAVALFGLRPFYEGFGDIYQGVYVEAWGTLFDILIVGVILSFFARRRDRRERIERYLEEIDDFKKWIRSRSQGDIVAQPPQHLYPLRGRPRRRHPLPGDGAHRG